MTLVKQMLFDHVDGADNPETRAGADQEHDQNLVFHRFDRQSAEVSGYPFCSYAKYYSKVLDRIPNL